MLQRRFNMVSSIGAFIFASPAVFLHPINTIRSGKPAGVLVGAKGLEDIALTSAISQLYPAAQGDRGEIQG